MQITIRPTYRRDSFIGFHLQLNGKPIGKVYRSYKHAALALVQL